MIPACIFAKPPVSGKVKTRLAASLGPECAAELAAAMLRDVWQTVCSCPGVHAVLATDEDGEFPIHVPPGDLWLQGGGDLGSRVESILRRALTHAPAALAIGGTRRSYPPWRSLRRSSHCKQRTL